MFYQTLQIRELIKRTETCGQAIKILQYEMDLVSQEVIKK